MPLPYVLLLPLFASELLVEYYLYHQIEVAVVSPPIVNVLPVANAVAVSALPVTLPVTLLLGCHMRATLSALLSSRVISTSIWGLRLLHLL